MAAWYKLKNEEEVFRVFDLTQYNSAHQMLRAFWLDLINGARGCTVYFHNWSGYDAYLSLDALLSLTNQGFTFVPTINHGRLISLVVSQSSKIVLTIKDSFKVIPGSLGKLAKDFQVETQKAHFPHYFNPVELYEKLDWSGSIPPYEYFEPKRTSKSDWDEMAQQFQSVEWNFLEVSRSYIQGDVIALYQILRIFFTQLNDTISD